ncbi:hypothetical protein GN956_G19606 [Arapaima gigas]
MSDVTRLQGALRKSTQLLAQVYTEASEPPGGRGASLTASSHSMYSDVRRWKNTDDTILLYQELVLCCVPS